MFRRFVKFIIRKEDIIDVIDMLSVYGENRILSMKDGKWYAVSLYCDRRDFQRLTDDILGLTRNGVSIRRLDIRARV